MTGEHDIVERARIFLQQGFDADRLYDEWFHDGEEEPVVWPDAGTYRSAIFDTDRFENGWAVRSTLPFPPGAIVAECEGFERHCFALQYAASDRKKLHVTAGDPIEVDPLAYDESGGFWHMWSKSWQQHAPTKIQRVYFNATSEGIVRLAQTLVRKAPKSFAWSAKFLYGVMPRHRRDTALLYLDANASEATSFVDEIAREAQRFCRPSRVPFIHGLKPGIGTVPDPGQNRSFGQAVCDGVAELGEFAGDPEQFRKEVAEVVRSLGGCMQ